MPSVIIIGGPAKDRQFLEDGWVLNRSYTAAVAGNGGTPYFVSEPSLAQDYAEFGDVLILPGTTWFSPEGDGLDVLKRREKEMIEMNRIFFEAFLQRNKTIIGICQGFQLINSFLGGTIKCDFKLQGGVEHFLTAHEIRAEKDSVLYRLYGERFVVNSRHNMCLDEVSPRLRVTAVSPDGIAEAFEGKDAPIYGFQWHPERMRGDFPEPYNGVNTDRLFQYLIGQK